MFREEKGMFDETTEWTMLTTEQTLKLVVTMISKPTPRSRILLGELTARSTRQ
jgi:hypothetical protein